jgi:DNA-binding transcriptional ArsR family regulator
MPPGKAYGNATGTLPEGIDVRGAGGYMVAKPSLHKSGRRYEFVEGHSLADLDPASLPQFLIDILEAAQTTPAQDVQFSRRKENAPDLTVWPLSDATLELILGGHPAGADRSAYDQKVITALLIAGADNDDIRDVFANFPIGEKYNERGDKYLAHSIGKARAWLADHSFEQAQPSILPQLYALRSWAQSPELTTLLIDGGIARPAEYEKTLIAIINYAITRRAPRVLLGSHRLGEMTGYSHMTAKRHLAMFGEGIITIHKDGTSTHRDGLKLVTVTGDPDGYGKWIDLTDLLRSVNLSVNHPTVERVNTSQQVTNDHLADEAFVPYPRHFAIKMRPDAQILPHGLSAAALLIVAVLVECGELTRDAICKLTGLSDYTVGRVLRRMAGMGLLTVFEGKPYRYELHPNFDEKLDDLRPQLPSYELTRRRGYVKAKACITFVSRRIHDTEPGSREEAKLLVRRDRYEKAMQEHIDCAAAKGVDVTAPLMEPRETEEQAKNRIHQAHLDRLRCAQRVGERAELRPKNYTETDEEMLSFARDISDKYKRMVYVYDRNSAETGWADLNAWALMTYGAGWWMHRDQADIVQDFRLFKNGGVQPPSIHFDGPMEAAA